MRAHTEATLEHPEQALSPRRLLMLRELDRAGASVTVAAVGELARLGYSGAARVVQVSRLIGPSGNRRTVETIIELRLECSRAMLLLGAIPHGVRPLGVGADPVWRRALLELEEPVLRECVASCGSPAALRGVVLGAYGRQQAGARGA